MKLTAFGTKVVGIKVTGNPKDCEQECIRIEFPGGQVDVTRAKDGENPDYWIHLRVFTPEDRDRWPGDELQPARISGARIDIHGRHTSDVNCGELDNPKVYHAAFRVTREAK